MLHQQNRMEIKLGKNWEERERKVWKDFGIGSHSKTRQGPHAVPALTVLVMLEAGVSRHATVL